MLYFWSVLWILKVKLELKLVIIDARNLTKPFGLKMFSDNYHSLQSGLTLVPCCHKLSIYGGGVNPRPRWRAYFTDLAIKRSAWKYERLGRGTGLPSGSYCKLACFNRGWTGCAPKRDTQTHKITHKLADRHQIPVAVRWCRKRRALIWF